MNSPNTYKRYSKVLLAATILLTPAALLAQHNAWPSSPIDPLTVNSNSPLVYIVPTGVETSSLYHDGSELEVATEQRWRFMCGGDNSGYTLDDLMRIAQKDQIAFEHGPAVIIDSGLRGSGLNLIFNCDSTVPTQALSAFAIAEAYLEGLFSDSMTVTINCRFDALGGGTLGATSSVYTTISYNLSRSGLQYGMDSNDVLPSWLPTGNGCPVRYNGSSPTVSYATSIDWTKANYKATIGSLSGLDATMTYNSGTSWDYQPADGISYTRISFVDVVCHETGHALGFTSGTDTGTQMHALDLFRFCRLDGSYNYNPDTYQDFQVTPRILCYNNPDDQQNTDLIDATYRMEDGNPHQASHFREINNYGCMGPTFGNAFTRHPNYFTSADIDVFDAIGYDYPPCDAPDFTMQPTPTQTCCLGDVVQLSVAVDVPTATFQWRRGHVTLVDDGQHIFGATSATLTIVGITLSDAASNYNCVARNTVTDCASFSDNAEILVDANAPVFTLHPVGSEVTAGDPVIMTIQLNSPYLVSYQWHKNGNPLNDDGRITGTQTTMLVIYPSQVSDSGQYTCVATSQQGIFCSTTSNPATLVVNPDGQGCPNPGSTGNYCTGDIDGSGDCIVGLSDLAQLLANYGMASGATREHGDIEPPGGDGDVDLSDLAALLAQYGDNCN